jgi:thiol-disulfide isomerase/thioredoxin
MLGALLHAGCDSQKSPAPEASAERPAHAQPSGQPPRRAERAAALPYSVPEQTVGQLATALAAACSDAKSRAQLVLLEFSAPWCADCRRLNAMKQDAQLASALSHVQQVVVNVGDFDLHTQLLEGFGVRAIARWELLAPDNCELPAWRWPRRGGRTLEPETGRRRITPAALAQWLETRSAG